MTSFKTSDVAFVTGGGSGIGRATCQLFARRGATVVVADIDKKAADETVLSLTGDSHMGVQLDVTLKQAVERVMDDVQDRYGTPPSMIVNCAGLMLHQGLLDLSEDTYDRIFNVNVKGTVWVSQAACQRLLAENKTGSIVNIASIAKQGVPRMAIYSATKAAVEAFSSSIAKEFGPNGIRVNCVSPGFTDTPMMEPFPERRKEQYIKTNPLGRPGRPDEIAEVILFLSGQGSSYVNGTSMFVHGGAL